MENRFYLLNKEVPLIIARHTLFKEVHALEAVILKSKITGVKARALQDLSGRMTVVFVGLPGQVSFPVRVMAVLSNFTAGLDMKQFPRSTMGPNDFPIAPTLLTPAFWEWFDHLPDRGLLSPFISHPKSLRAWKDDNRELLKLSKYPRTKWEDRLRDIKHHNAGSLWCQGTLLTGTLPAPTKETVEP
jgi:hypothetical protein